MYQYWEDGAAGAPNGSAAVCINVLDLVAELTVTGDTLTNETVVAVFDKTIEEFEIDTTEEGEGEGVKAFGEDDEDGEDGEDGDDFGDEDFEDGDDFEDEGSSDEEETKLESFNSFIKKRK